MGYCNDRERLTCSGIDAPHACSHADDGASEKEVPMIRMTCLAGTVFAASALSLLSPLPAGAVVYCKAVGVPKGCVVRPATTVVVTPAPVVVAPAPVVVAPAARAVGRPGTVWNRGGPVNRIGRR
jgi:hypothetical protein